MSDALCGPSNPLQQFKQQTQLDRTLQQDRLASRASPSQGFRSVDPNTGILDPEFEAFQAGLPPSELPQFHQPPPSLSGPSHAPSWANDFQRMHISSPQPFQQAQQFSTAAPATASNWAQGFQQHIAQTVPRTQTSAPSPQAFQYMARYGSNSYQNSFAIPATSTTFPPKGKAVAAEQFDDAAFERAFDQARDAMLYDEQRDQTSLAQEELAYANGASTGDLDHAEKGNHELQDYQLQLMLLEQQNKKRNMMERQAQLALEQNLAAEVMNANHEPALEDEQMQDNVQHDDDALAMTAQELLEKVEHNQTDKFRNSQFLGLMRKLRDREVKVEGDKMVETVRASPSKHLYPPTSAPDSTYGSGGATPDHVTANGPFLNPPRTPPPEFDSHVEYGWDREHQFDHWESPYR